MRLRRGGVSASPAAPAAPCDAVVIITALGLTQILAWGSSYYLLAVLAPADRRGHRLAAALGRRRAVASGLLAAGLVSPRVGRAIEHRGGRPVLAASAGPVRRRAVRPGARPEPARLSRRLARPRPRHGCRPLRCRVRHAGPPVRAERAPGDHHPDPVRRVRQHRMLAALGLAHRRAGLARHLPGLRRPAPRGGAAAIPGRHPQAVPSGPGPAADAASAPTKRQRPARRGRCSSCWRRPSRSDRRSRP